MWNTLTFYLQSTFQTEYLCTFFCCIWTFTWVKSGTSSSAAMIMSYYSLQLLHYVGVGGRALCMTGQSQSLKSVKTDYLGQIWQRYHTCQYFQRKQCGAMGTVQTECFYLQSLTVNSDFLHLNPRVFELRDVKKRFQKKERSKDFKNVFVINV